MRPLSLSAFAAILAVLVAGSLAPAFPQVSPVADGFLNDGSGPSFPKDDDPDLVFDNVPVLEIFDVPDAEQRAVLEFDITSFAAGAGVELQLHRSASNGPFPFTVDVFGYVGNGSVTEADWNPPSSTFIASFSYNDQETVRIDVTDFVQGLIAGGETHAGFNLQFSEPSAIELNGPFVGFHSRNGGAPPQLRAISRDLAAVGLKASRQARGAAPVTKPVKVTIQNRSEMNETFALADLGDGVSTGLVRLAVSRIDDDDEGCQEAVVALDPKNAKKFAKGPVVLKPRQKFAVRFLVTYQCTSAQGRAAGDTTGGDYVHVATVHLDALGAVDIHPEDDQCPHADGHDPNPAPKGVVDRGCGVKGVGGLRLAPEVDIVGP